MATTIDDLLGQEDAIDFALEQLAGFILDTRVCPNRKIILADKNDTVLTTDYLTVKILSDINKSGIYSENPVRYNMDSLGVETYVYSHILTLQLRTFIGDAFKDMRHIKTMLRNKNLNEKYFHSKGSVAITQIGTATNNPTITDEQSSEPSATMQVSIGYTWKYVEDSGNYVDDIIFNTSTQTNEEGTDICESDDITVSVYQKTGY